MQLELAMCKNYTIKMVSIFTLTNVESTEVNFHCLQYPHEKKNHKSKYLESEGPMQITQCGYNTIGYFANWFAVFSAWLSRNFSSAKWDSSPGQCAPSYRASHTEPPSCFGLREEFMSFAHILKHKKYSYWK